MLDEAANVCRWANLPDLYSHYGSRRIVVSTFLQSWSQGVDVWGKFGMRKLLSTANVITHGGNVKEEGYLKMLSELIGKYTYTSVSSSRQKDSGSTSRQDATDDILSVADLAALPKGRAVMLGSGARAVLVRTVPVSARPYAEAAAASETAHNASVESTVTGKPALEHHGAEPSSTGPTGSRWADLVKEQAMDIGARRTNSHDYIDLSGRATTFTWCAQWQRHEEAVSRLSGLWRAQESQRTDPTTGLAVWGRDYADSTMRTLFDKKDSSTTALPRHTASI